MTTTVLLTGERHRVVWISPDDELIVGTDCDLTVANIGDPFDPTSAYQRAVFPPAVHPKPCLRCVS